MEEKGIMHSALFMIHVIVMQLFGTNYLTPYTELWKIVIIFGKARLLHVQYAMRSRMHVQLEVE